MRAISTSLAILTAAIVATGLAGSANAASVLFVDNETPNSAWQTLIESGGHTYTLFDSSTFSFDLDVPANAAYVESFDVAVISGSDAAFNALRNNGSSWTARSTPLISMAAFLNTGTFSGDSAWFWTTNNQADPSNASGPVDVLDETDPIWNGVALTPGTPPTTDLLNIGERHIFLDGQALRPGVEALAVQSSDNEFIAVAQADPGVLGVQEQYFIAGMSGNAGQPPSFTPVGEQVFLNAIDALAPTVIPEPGTLVLAGVGVGLIGLRRRQR